MARRHAVYDLVTILAATGDEPYAFKLDNAAFTDARVAQRLQQLKVAWAPCDVSDGVHVGHVDGYAITATKIVLVCVMKREYAPTARTMSLTLAAHIVRNAFPGYGVDALAVCRGPMDITVRRVDVNDVVAAKDLVRRHAAHTQ